MLGAGYPLRSLWSPLPRGIPRERLRDFERDVGPAEDSGLERASRVVQDHLAAGPDHCAI